jgi:propanol-preferring alcohol dehydrogenase
MIETVPLQEAPAAYAKMMAGKARFRMVLVMNNGGSEGASRQSQIKS